MYFNHTDPKAINMVSKELHKIITPETIIMCIGTDRSTGDALGPLVGSKILGKIPNPVYGTLDNPVHATNLKEVLASIDQTAGVLAIDACLGKIENVGFISLNSGAILPGAAVNKDLPAVGSNHLVGIVNVGGFMEHMVLQSTRLSLVTNIGNVIAKSIIKTVKRQLKNRGKSAKELPKYNEGKVVSMINFLKGR